MNQALRDLIKNIEEHLLARGWKQKDLAEASGLTQGAISTYLSGKVAPQFDALSKIAAAFGVHPSRLLMGEEVDGTIVRYKRVTPPKAEIIEMVRRELFFLNRIPEEAQELLREVCDRNLWEGLLPVLRSVVKRSAAGAGGAGKSRRS